jgi:hypothetical protein
VKHSSTKIKNPKENKDERRKQVFALVALGAQCKRTREQRFKGQNIISSKAKTLNVQKIKAKG